MTLLPYPKLTLVFCFLSEALIAAAYAFLTWERNTYIMNAADKALFPT